MTRTQLEEYISENYNAVPEHPWVPDSDNTVFRHSNNRKWFALVMEIPKYKLGLTGEGDICVVNLKCDPAMVGSLLLEDGLFPAWHMNKTHWISAAVSENTDEDRLKFLLDLSFELTAKRVHRKAEKYNTGKSSEE